MSCAEVAVIAGDRKAGRWQHVWRLPRRQLDHHLQPLQLTKAGRHWNFFGLLRSQSLLLKGSSRQFFIPITTQRPTGPTLILHEGVHTPKDT